MRDRHPEVAPTSPAAPVRLAFTADVAAAIPAAAAGDGAFTIQPGEAVEFLYLDANWFGAVDGPVELIMIAGPQGERLHLHA